VKTLIILLPSPWLAFTLQCNRQTIELHRELPQVLVLPHALVLGLRRCQDSFNIRHVVTNRLETKFLQSHSIKVIYFSITYKKVTIGTIPYFICNYNFSHFLKRTRSKPGLAKTYLLNELLNSQGGVHIFKGLIRPLAIIRRPSSGSVPAENTCLVNLGWSNR